jgi:hypothetical protein
MVNHAPGTAGAIANAQAKDRDLRMFSVEMAVKVGQNGEASSETLDRAVLIYGFISE